MEESEFVVVDDDHRAYNELKETVKAYGNARDALFKGVALLSDTLNLTMELALKNAPPDFESDPEELRRSVLGSVEFSSEAVLRDHVKSLCSKLVAVQSQYEDLAKKYEDLRMEKSAEQLPQVTRLAGILAEIDACLPDSDLETSTTSTSMGAADLNELCARAENIRDRVRVAMTKPVPVVLTNSVSCDSKDLEEGPSTPKGDSGMDISRMIREEVSSVLKSEMGGMMERQMDYIQEALKPLKVGEQSPTTSQTSESFPAQPPSSFEYYDDRACPSSPDPPQTPRATKPSFLPDDERPLCPKCQIWLPDRHALETHLDSCLE